jgi:hypothetical protein
MSVSTKKSCTVQFKNQKLRSRNLKTFEHQTTTEPLLGNILHIINTQENTWSIIIRFFFNKVYHHSSQRLGRVWLGSGSGSVAAPAEEPLLPVR